MNEEENGEARQSEESKSDVDSEAEQTNCEDRVSGSEAETTEVVTKRKTSEVAVFKELGVLAGSTAAIAVMIYILLTLLGLPLASRPLVVSKGASKPFFMGRQRKLIEDNYDGTIKLSGNTSLSVILLYSPYSYPSKQFREEYYEAARAMNKLHGEHAPYFGATNCFDSQSYCRQKHNLKHYPALMAQNYAMMGSVYNGPMTAPYVIRWLNRLQNIVFRIQTTDELVPLSRIHDVIVILYYKIRTPPTEFQSAVNFTKAAFHYHNGDPNTERTIFCMVTDENLALQFQLYNEHDVVIVSSELRLLATLYKGWEIEQLFNEVTAFAEKSVQQSIEFLNLGRRFASTQLAEKMHTGSVLLYFTRNMNYGNKKYQMFREIAREYLTCPEKDLISVEIEDPLKKYQEDCSISLKETLCHKNNTLSFMIIDSQIEPQIAAKVGASKTDMVIAVDARQEITRFIQGNVSRENINCLIRQHHNTADNAFVTETPRILPKQDYVYQDQHPDAVGEASVIKFVDNVADLLTCKKINVIMFSGGTYHSASMSAIAPFHLVAHHFKGAKTLISFSIVDISKTYVPYNLNFEALPRILITSADSIGLSWTYPEDFMINHTNIVKFVLSRPGKIFGRLRWLDSCQGDCRKRARWEMRFERSQLQRQLSRNVTNRLRQRALIGYYDRMLRMMG